MFFAVLCHLSVSSISQNSVFLHVEFSGLIRMEAFLAGWNLLELVWCCHTGSECHTLALVLRSQLQPLLLTKENEACLVCQQLSNTPSREWHLMAMVAVWLGTLSYSVTFQGSSSVKDPAESPGWGRIIQNSEKNTSFFMKHGIWNEPPKTTH